MSRRNAAFAGGALAAALGAPAAAEAHGLVGRADLPIPIELFSYAAAAVLVASFVALAVLWPTPRLEGDRFRPLPAGFSRAVTGPVTEIAAGAVGVALFVLVLYAALVGTEGISDNLAPTFIYVAFWLGLVPVSVVFGDVFRALNPWRAVGRAAGAALGDRAPEPIPYPDRLGRWPAVVGLVGFGVLELVVSSGDQPSTLAIAILVYSSVTFFAIALFGTEAWIRHGETFSVYFNLLARLSPFERRGRVIGVRPPLSGLTRLDIVPGTVAFVAAMIGIVTFDGLSNGPAWQDLLLGPRDALRDLGLGARAALELTYLGALVLCILAVYGFYRLGIEGTQSVDRTKPARRLSREFIHSLVPIALAYAAAHYVSLLLFQGQALAALASDPFGTGADLLGTADSGIDYGFVSAEAFWYIQVGFVLAGHLAALVLAHDRALVVYDDARVATRSQYWMLAVMVGFTTLALWLLSEASKG